MQRNMDLVRIILMELEKKEEIGPTMNFAVKGYTFEEVAYHCKLMHEAGLIDLYREQSADNRVYCFVIGDLTWEGQDFLGKIRQDTIWNKTKAFIGEKGLPAAYDVFKEVSSAFIQAAVQGAIKGLSNPF